MSVETTLAREPARPQEEIESDKAPPLLEISIGRIEVRPPPQPEPLRRIVQQRQGHLSLDDVLNRRGSSQ